MTPAEAQGTARPPPRHPRLSQRAPPAARAPDTADAQEARMSTSPAVQPRKQKEALIPTVC